MLKDRRTYEIMRPEDVGVPRDDAGARQALGPPRRAAPLRAARLHARAPRARDGLPRRHRARRPQKAVSDGDLADDRRQRPRRAAARRPQPPRRRRTSHATPAEVGYGTASSTVRFAVDRLAGRRVPQSARSLGGLPHACGTVPALAAATNIREQPTAELENPSEPRRTAERSHPSAPGDGIGPEVVAGAASVLAPSPPLRSSVRPARSAIGGAALRRGLPPLPDETLAAAREADAMLLGAVGDPAFDHGARRAGRRRRCSRFAGGSACTRTCGRRASGRGSRRRVR